MTRSTRTRYASLALACAMVLSALYCLAPQDDFAPAGISQMAASGHFESPEPAEALVSTVRKPVSVMDGKLSLNVSRMPLRSLLGDIARQSRVDIRWAAELSLLPMSATMTEAPLVEGLASLLRDFDVLVLFQSAGEPSSSLRLIHVYPKGGVQALMPSASDIDLAAALATRAGMFDEAGKANAEAASGRGSLSDVRQGLQSPDPDVRRRALAKSFEWQLVLPVQMLEQLARSDTDQRMRKLALVALAQGPESEGPVVRATIEAAMGDSDADVRQQANLLLEQLTMAAVPSDAVPQLSRN